jgi:hypothetical protein
MAVQGRAAYGAQEAFGSDGNPKSGNDYAASKRLARQNESAQRAAIEDQMRSEGLDPKTNQLSNPVPYRPAFVPQSVHSAVKSSSGGSVAGIFLGALLFFTGRAYVTGQWPGVKAWYAAKFLNKTSAEPNNLPASTVTGSTSSSSAPTSTKTTTPVQAKPAAVTTTNPNTGVTSTPNPVIQTVAV